MSEASGRGPGAGSAKVAVVMGDFVHGTAVFRDYGDAPPAGFADDVERLLGASCRRFFGACLGAHYADLEFVYPTVEWAIQSLVEMRQRFDELMSAKYPSVLQVGVYGAVDHVTVCIPYDAGDVTEFETVARLMGAARPDRILVTERALSRASADLQRCFTFYDRLEVKGVAEPVPTYVLEAKGGASL